jgi:N-acetylneuraminic acid mutarotase
MASGGPHADPARQPRRCRRQRPDLCLRRRQRPWVHQTGRSGHLGQRGGPIAKWEPIAKLPRRLRGPGTAAFDGKIYLFGGEVHGGGFTGEVHVYDPHTDSWSSDAQPMPTGRGFVRVAGLDEWLYAIGGANNDGFLDTVERYRPATDRWEDVAPMGHRRGGPGVVTVNDRIYVVGGSFGDFGPGSDAEKSSEVFAEPAWHPLDAVFPVGRSNLRAERASGNRILAIGGFKAPGGPGTTVPSRLVEALKI